MNFIEITVTIDADNQETRNTLLNLDKVISVKLSEKLLFNPQRKVKWLSIHTEGGFYGVQHNEAYAIALYQQLQKLSIQNWTQEELS